MSYLKKTSRGFLKYWFVLLALLAVTIIVAVLELTNITHFFHKTGVVSSPSSPIVSLPQQPATSKSPSTGPTISQGTTNDKNGQVSSSGISSNSSNWATSASGAIILKLPVRNTVFRSGDIITGTSNVDPIQYRLVDNQVGVIAQGRLNVVNGDFSATVNFTPHSTSGQLDVFNTNSNGVEYNEIQIPVNL